MEGLFLMKLEVGTDTKKSKHFRRIELRMCEKRKKEKKKKVQDESKKF
jgi:hypothetical protein